MAKFTQEIDLATLKSLLAYDPLTGQFTWRVRQRQIGRFTEIGELAGFKETTGYWCIGLQRRQYKAHRLAWFYVHGKWPTEDVDHINGHRDDNRITNLRIGGRSGNPRNAKRKSNNTTGFKGVSPSGQKFMARINVDYKRLYLGTFETPEEAHEAYIVAAQKYFGEFARAA